MKRVIIPKLDDNFNQIGTTEVVISDNPDTENYNKVMDEFW